MVLMHHKNNLVLYIQMVLNSDDKLNEFEEAKIINKKIMLLIIVFLHKTTSI